MSGSNKKNTNDLVFNENFGEEPEPPPPLPSQPAVVNIPDVEPEATVPAVTAEGSNKAKKETAEEEDVVLDFTDSTTVPVAAGNIEEENQPLTKPPEEEQERRGRFAWFSIRQFSVYFNVDTKEVLERLLNSLKGPFKPDFIDKVEENPDLYGPFWIASTLIFLTVVSSNVASYTDHRKSDDATEEWDGDYSKFIPASLLYYVYVFLLGLVVFFALKAYSAQMTLIQVWCIYGYALSPLLPVVFLMCLSQAITNEKGADALTIMIAIIGTLYSGSFLIMNFRKALLAFGTKIYVMILGMAACHVFLGLFLAFYFH